MTRFFGPPTSLRAGVAWATSGSAVYLACQYGMLIAIAKLGTAANVGQFALAQAIAAPVIILSQMQLRQVQVTDVAGTLAFAHYLTARLAATLAAGIIIALVAVGAGYRGEMLAVVGFVTIAKSLESISDIVHGRMQRSERMDVVAKSLVWKGLLSLLAFVATLWLTRNLAAAAAAIAAVWGLVLLFYDVPRGMQPDETVRRLLQWDPRTTLALARTALPLTIAAGLGSVSSNLPRYFLEAARGPEAVGLFVVAATPLALLGLTNTAVSQATLARAAGHFQAAQFELFSRLGKRIVLFQVCTAALLALVFGTLGGPLMRVLFAEEYVAAAPIAAIMAAGSAVGGLAGWGATVLMAARRFRLQLWNIVVVIAVQIPLCYWLIGRFGVTGAGWSEFGRYCFAAAFLLVAGNLVFRSERARAAHLNAGPPVAGAPAGAPLRLSEPLRNV